MTGIHYTAFSGAGLSSSFGASRVPFASVE